MTEKLEEFFFFLKFKRGDIFLSSKEGAKSNKRSAGCLCIRDKGAAFSTDAAANMCKEIQIKKKRNTD